MGYNGFIERDAVMAKQSYRVFGSVGSSVIAQLAHREGDKTADGKDVYFIRYRVRDPRYGYKWTPWEKTEQKPYLKSNGHDPASYSETESGWSEIMGVYKPNVKLPALPRV